jgi:hypothetical protein
MNDKINKTTYTYSKLYKDVGIGNRKTWKNLINHQDYSKYFDIAKDDYVHNRFETELTLDELRNIMKEQLVHFCF